MCNALQWRHNERDSVSNHQPYHCLLNRLFRRRSKKTSKLRVTGLCAGNSPGTGEFPEQMASNAENVSIWWRHHGRRTCVAILSMPTTDTVYGKFQQSLVLKSNITTYMLRARYSYFQRILTFTRWNWKCHVIIVIKTDLSGFVVTMQLRMNILMTNILKEYHWCVYI